MNMLGRLAIVPVLIGLLGAAQEPDTRDWDLQEDVRARTTAALIRTTAGPTLVVRCQRGALTAFVTGLPEDTREERAIRIAFDDLPLRTTTWTNSVDGTAAFSDLPAPLARSFRAGGLLNLVLPGAGEGGRNLRYRLTLPPSTVAIDATLTACDRPLVDPRDAQLAAISEGGLPDGLVWAVRPQVLLSSIDYLHGFAVVSCLTTIEGSLRDCVLETEYPHDRGLGKAVMASTSRARVGLPATAGDATRAPTGAVLVRFNVYAEGYRQEKIRERERRRTPFSRIN